MGCTAAKMTRSALPLLWKLTAIEALALAQAADLRKDEGKEVIGADYRKLYDLVRKVSPHVAKDRPLADDIGQVMSLLQSEDMQAECLGSKPTDEPD